MAAITLIPPRPCVAPGRCQRPRPAGHCAQPRRTHTRPCTRPPSTAAPILKDPRRALVDGPTDTGFALGLAILPAYGATVWNAPQFLPEYRLWGIGSLRSSWAVYCSHAISHAAGATWGPFGSNNGMRARDRQHRHALRHLPSTDPAQHAPRSWARRRARCARALARRPADRRRHRALAPYPPLGAVARAWRSAATTRAAMTASAADVEALFQALSVALHAVAPLLAVSIGLRSAPADGADRRQPLARDPGGSVARRVDRRRGRLRRRGSAAPMLFYVGSQVLWLSPLNPLALDVPAPLRRAPSRPSRSTRPTTPSARRSTRTAATRTTTSSTTTSPSCQCTCCRASADRARALRAAALVLGARPERGSRTRREFFYACQDTLYDSE